jgi:hypothetical protein
MMNVKKLLSGVLFIGLALVLVGGVGLTSAQGPKPPGGLAVQAQAVSTAFTYQGRLTDGGSPANGEYDFRFMLYDAATAGSQVGSTVLKGNTDVTDGLFTVELDFGSGIFTGGARYLAIGVRPGSSTGAYTTLLPRQALTPAPYALSLRPGAQVISEEYGGDAVYAENTTSSGTGVVGEASAASGNTFGVRGLNLSSGGTGVYGWAGSSTSGTDGRPYGVYGYSNKGHGVYGVTLGDWSNISGVYGKAVFDHANGVNGVNTAGGYGVRAESNTGVALAAKSADGNLIEAWDLDPNDRRWYVRNDGEVYADGSFHSGGADFVEMLPAVEGLEPGDVLVVGSDGQLLRSSSTYDVSVVGVYSTQPGFIGGSDEEMENPGDVPLAVVGVVPVKASAENGPIAPGDLLTTSSTPGHAMKAGANPTVGTVIGKALQSLETGTGVIRMLVTLQ